MKQRHLLVLVLFMLSAMVAQAQTYEKLWKDVARMEQKDLPKSVLALTETIYRKAIQERNAPEAMKAYWQAMQYRQMVTPDSIYTDIKGLEQWAQETKEPLDAAVLNAMLGDLYGSMLNGDRYNRTPDLTAVDGFADDMREWGRDAYIRKSYEYFMRSLKDVDLLGKTSVDAFRPIVIKGDASKYFHHDMLHLLGMTAINFLSANSSYAAMQYPQTGRADTLSYWSTESFLKLKIPQASQYDYMAGVLQIYQTMLRYYSEHSMQDAALLTDIERLAFMQNSLMLYSNAGQSASSPYYRQLRAMQEKYASQDVCAEVYIQMAEFSRSRSDLVEALRLAREGIRKYPRYNRIDALKNIEKGILNPRLTINVASLVYPGDSLFMKISYCNLPSAMITLYRVNLPAYSEKLWDVQTKGLPSSCLKRVSAEEMVFDSTPDYQLKDTVFGLSVPEEGIYLIKLSSDRKDVSPGYDLLYVSRLKVISIGLPDNKMEIVVVDARSGHPVPNSEVTLYNRKNNQFTPINNYMTNKNGVVTIGKQESGVYIQARKDNDTGMQLQRISAYFVKGNNNAKPYERINLFTDRSIYRPGQTVYLSGIAYRQDGDSTSVLADKSYTVQLLDVNQKKIAEHSVRTNSFGSFSGEFMLPSPCLTGRYSLRVDDVWTDASIQVEEYKRPTFDVTLLPVQGAYAVGDSVWVTGVAKTFSGVPLQDVMVKYHVNRSPALWRWEARQYGIASGEVKTNDKGEFKIRVYLEPDQSNSGLSVWYNSFMVEASVTDVAGETQSGSLRLAVGSSSMVLSADLPDNVEKEQFNKLVFSAENLDHQPLTVKGEYAVYQLQDSRSSGTDAVRQNLYNGDATGKVGKCLLKETFVSGETFDPIAIKALPSGRYRLVLSAKDSLGKEAGYEQYFVLFSINDKKPPFDMQDWLYLPDNKFAPGKDATLLFGSSAKDVYVFYDVFSGNKRLDSQRFLLTDSIVKKVYPYKEEYGDGILVCFAFVKDGVLCQQSARIVKAQPEKRLEMKWSVFRDKLLPGQKEEWRLNIRYPDGKPANAELLATMYDASLDKLLKHDWNFNLSFYRSTPSVSWYGGYPSLNYLGLYFPLKYLTVELLSFDRLMMDDLLILGSTFNAVSPIKRVGYLAGASKGMRTKGSYDYVVEANVMTAEVELLTDAAPESAEDVEDAPESAVRTDFAETAFFYPQLRTNADGEVSFSFILPESLTEWKFMGLSHTKNMDWAKLTANAVARKEFMVSPNIPRFVRIGDHTSVASNIINLTDKTISGTVRMELFNPVDDKVFFKQKQTFAVEAGKTEAVTFAFDVKDNMDVMACRIVADGGTFSDGEQRYVPVLTDKEWITESIPMTVVGEETKTYSLEGLFNKGSKTATDRKLTVEFTGNPAWYAVQALPSLSNPTNEDAISWVSAYYANNVASYIVNANPRIKAVFDAWRAQGGTKETLWSNLQKNQELKNILLEESPWLTEATNEAEQKQRIALLFDLNRQQSENAVAINKLQSLQLADGAWTWYKGMSGSRYITQYVVEALGRMQVLTGKPLEGEALVMYDKAFAYLNDEALKEYKLMQEAERKGDKDWLPSELTVHYLYICMLTDAKLSAANRRANAYFIDKLANSVGLQTIYGKALSAIILEKAGKTVAARDFMASLQEYAVETKDMGMYYDTKKAVYSYSAYRIPTQVAVIEAMELVSKNMKAVEQLKIWLLMQKRTQAWDSPMATVDAIYALLNRGTSLLDNQGDVRIVLGNKVLETATSAKTTAPGLGYVKETLTGKEITPNMKKITVEKKDAGVAWGAVYAQYLENMDKVTQQGGPLSVDKKLYIEKMADGRAQLVPLVDTSVLQTGDKVVVRLVIRTDRDMDFVQLKDERAACLEPLTTLSGYRWQNGIGYYLAVKDASSEFFIESLRKGTYTLDSTYYVSRDGEYATGIATIQSAYAPEYSAHTGSNRIKVIEK